MSKRGLEVITALQKPLNRTQEQNPFMCLAKIPYVRKNCLPQGNGYVTKSVIEIQYILFDGSQSSPTSREPFTLVPRLDGIEYPVGIPSF